MVASGNEEKLLSVCLAALSTHAGSESLLYSAAVLVDAILVHRLLRGDVEVDADSAGSGATIVVQLVAAANGSVSYRTLLALLQATTAAVRVAKQHTRGVDVAEAVLAESGRVLESLSARIKGADKAEAQRLAPIAAQALWCISEAVGVSTEVDTSHVAPNRAGAGGSAGAGVAALGDTMAAHIVTLATGIAAAGDGPSFVVGVQALRRTAQRWGGRLFKDGDANTEALVSCLLSAVRALRHMALTAHASTTDAAVSAQAFAEVHAFARGHVKSTHGEASSESEGSGFASLAEEAQAAATACAGKSRPRGRRRHADAEPRALEQPARLRAMPTAVSCWSQSQMVATWLRDPCGLGTVTGDSEDWELVTTVVASPVLKSRQDRAPPAGGSESKQDGPDVVDTGSAGGDGDGSCCIQ